MESNYSNRGYKVYGEVDIESIRAAMEILTDCGASTEDNPEYSRALHELWRMITDTSVNPSPFSEQLELMGVDE